MSDIKHSVNLSAKQGRSSRATLSLITCLSDICSSFLLIEPCPYLQYSDSNGKKHFILSTLENPKEIPQLYISIQANLCLQDKFRQVKI